MANNSTGINFKMKMGLARNCTNDLILKIRIMGSKNKSRAI